MYFYKCKYVIEKLLVSFVEILLNVRNILIFISKNETLVRVIKKNLLVKFQKVRKI